MCQSVQDTREKKRGNKIEGSPWWSKVEGEELSVSGCSEIQRGKGTCWGAGPAPAAGGQGRLVWGTPVRNSKGEVETPCARVGSGECWQREVQAKAKQVQRPRGDSKLGTKRLLPSLEATEGFEAGDSWAFLLNTKTRKAWRQCGSPVTPQEMTAM